MRPLTISGAKHFVGNFGNNANVQGYSVEDYLATLSPGSTTFIEGTSQFNELKDCLLRESERSILISNNCYARALESLRANSAYWTIVGLYYASFFSVKAVLGMHGCWMGGAKRWIEIVDSNPGFQKIAFTVQKYPNNEGKTGSHQITWIAFYNAMTHLSTWFSSANANLAINPVNSNKTWLIDTRNDVNYDPLAAFAMMSQFETDYDPKNLPGCFGGKLQTMLKTSQAFVQFAKEIAISNALSTDVWMPETTRIDWSKKHITSVQDPQLTTYALSEFPILEY